MTVRTLGTDPSIVAAPEATCPPKGRATVGPFTLPVAMAVMGVSIPDEAGWFWSGKPKVKFATKPERPFAAAIICPAACCEAT